MHDEQPVDGLVHELEGRRKRDVPRRVITILLVLWLVTAVALALVAWNAYFSEKRESQTLAQQIAVACDSGDLGPDMSPENIDALCKNAEEVLEKDDPELQDGEIQESEIQDPELQESEVQEREDQEREIQERERQNLEQEDFEIQDGEDQEAEIQEDEIQDPENQDPENQDPEIDDPDPNDDIKSGSCTFDGSGTIRMTFETSSGPVTFECTGTQAPPGPSEGVPNG